MSADLDDDFLSSVGSLSKELQLLGVNNKILTTNEYVACQSLLGTAWMLVQLIHCNSVATAESTLHNERESKLRDELQTAQTQLQRFTDKLEDKEKQIKSLQLANRNLKTESLKWQDTAKYLNNKIKQLEIKIDKCHGFYKNELSAQAAKSEKLRDRLRSKLGVAKKISATLADSLDDVRISENYNRPQGIENKLAATKDTVVSLTTSNQILVEENLLMRDTFARLHRQLEAVRKHGVTVLETLGIDGDMDESDKCVYSHSIFNLPVSVVMKKLRNLGEAQTDAIVNIFRSIEKASPTFTHGRPNSRC